MLRMRGHWQPGKVWRALSKWCHPRRGRPRLVFWKRTRFWLWKMPVWYRKNVHLIQIGMGQGILQIPQLMLGALQCLQSFLFIWNVDLVCPRWPPCSQIAQKRLQHPGVPSSSCFNEIWKRKERGEKFTYCAPHQGMRWIYLNRNEEDFNHSLRNIIATLLEFPITWKSPNVYSWPGMQIDGEK